ncbi:TVP38/TMEM64 family protein [Halalkalibacterium halodurans]|jgi:uncharacterized membrane protein YdjX (TVP38/TMEM64 family)|uniref:TVP38/TMEM64 family membrane protein n=1 Tax=Halalkalibacterium halodurans TaxID=86665 RepID=A0A0M0KI80_ALKHA|nr:TVP38/TMEM64 family protein [Halalkalibacterium halodurans]MED4164299.1 TVP38/TMEM64 family protein [Halalkalibacterium halodurans]TPE69930.1 TVP38/TMEM64 family protein [Halalkalibacterium halodurans]
MEEMFETSLRVIEQSGWLAPVLFIMLHVFRQVFFIPVIIICLVGGYLFGSFYGSLYSIIGLTATSALFYGIVHGFPRFLAKVSQLKKRFLGEKESLSLPQMMLLRIVPFIHFHLVSLYVMETRPTFREYMKISFYLSMPPAIIYTLFGDMIHELPLVGTVVFALFIGLLCFMARRKEQRYAWQEFFKA